MRRRAFLVAASFPSRRLPDQVFVLVAKRAESVTRWPWRKLFGRAAPALRPAKRSRVPSNGTSTVRERAFGSQRALH